MVRLTAPNGATVDVSKEKAELLLSQGFQSAEGSSTKKSTSRKTSTTAKSE